MVGNLVGQVEKVQRGAKREHKTADLGSAVPRNKGHSAFFLVWIEDWGRGYT